MHPIISMNFHHQFSSHHHYNLNQRAIHTNLAKASLFRNPMIFLRQNHLRFRIDLAKLINSAGHVVFPFLMFFGTRNYSRNLLYFEIRQFSESNTFIGKIQIENEDAKESETIGDNIDDKDSKATPDNVEEKDSEIATE